MALSSTNQLQYWCSKNVHNPHSWSAGFDMGLQWINLSVSHLCFLPLPKWKELQSNVQETKRHLVYKAIQVPTSTKPGNVTGSCYHKEPPSSMHTRVSPCPYYHGMKETIFQIDSKLWAPSLEISRMTQEAKCFRCEETETKEHLMHGCESYSTQIGPCRMITLNGNLKTVRRLHTGN